jgi:hypothetical protein
MLLNRTKSWLLAWGLQVLIVSAAAAQTPAWAPGEIDGVQIFAQPDLSTYGTRTSTVGPNYGFFGGVDALFWTASGPDRTDIGLNGATRQVYVGNGSPIGSVGTQPNNAGNTFPAAGTPGAAIGGITQGTYTYQLAGSTATNTASVINYSFGNQAFNPASEFGTQSNTANTSFIAARIQTGLRFDFGYVDEETNRGWLFSGFNMQARTQTMTQQDAGVVWKEPNIAVYNGLTDNNGNQLVTSLPLLYGFIDASSGTNNFAPSNQYAMDINHNNIYGPNGRDVGVVASNTLTSGTTLDGIPDRELNTGGFTPSVYPARAPVDYGDAVPLPVLFNTLQAIERTTAKGVEANYLWRLGQGRKGGNWDLFSGARYFNFNDQFEVTAIGGILANSYWDTKSYNRMVGPQVGLRWSKQRGRVFFSGEGRFMTAADLQTVKQAGIIASELPQLLPSPNPPTLVTLTNPGGTINGNVVNNPPVTSVVQTTQPNNPGGGPNANHLNVPLNLQPTAFSSSANATAFSPLGELRAKVNYQVFRSLTVNVGWTGIFTTGVARAPNLIDYTLPSMGIDMSHNKQALILNGLTFGMEFNH